MAAVLASPAPARRRPAAHRAAVALLGLALIGATSCSGGPAKGKAVVHPGPFRVCATAANPPMVYAGAGPSGLRVTGFEVELLDAVARQVHRGLRVQLMSFGQVLARVQSGRCLIGVGSITVTPARRQHLLFSTPYFEEDRNVLVRQSSPIRSRAALAGQSVGVLVGTPEATSAAHDLPARVTVQRFATAAGLYAALADGTVAAVYADLSLNASQQITHRDLVSAYVRRTSVQDAIAVSSSAPDLVGDLNRGLAAVRADGTYRDLYRRYFSVSPS